MSDAASDFYSGLIADLYEPLAGDLADPAPYLRFVEKEGSPALELACGAGHPMLDLIAAGHDVQGVDASRDMLKLCAEKAEQRGVVASTHLQLMQSLKLPQQFRSCYIAGASFSLIDNLEDAQSALIRVFEHLQPSGAFLFSIFRPDIEPQPGIERRARRDDGSVISVQSISQVQIPKEQLTVTRLRYRVKREGRIVEEIEKDWRLRWYDRNQMTGLLERAGFTIESMRDFAGEPAQAESCDLSILARKVI